MDKEEENEAENESKGRVHGQNEIVEMQSGWVKLIECRGVEEMGKGEE